MISNFLGKEEAHYDPTREILITAGANAGLMATLLSCFQPGDSIALFSPTYASYFNQLRMAGLNPVYIPLKGNSWQVDLDLFADRIRTHNPKAVLICNPNNPTGSLFKKNELIEIARIAAQNGLLILCDEVYSYLLYDSE